MRIWSTARVAGSFDERVERVGQGYMICNSLQVGDRKLDEMSDEEVAALFRVASDQESDFPSDKSEFESIMTNKGHRMRSQNSFNLIKEDLRRYGVDIRSGIFRHATDADWVRLFDLHGAWRFIESKGKANVRQAIDFALSKARNVREFVEYVEAFAYVEREEMASPRQRSSKIECIEDEVSQVIKMIPHRSVSIDPRLLDKDLDYDAVGAIQNAVFRAGGYLMFMSNLAAITHFVKHASEDLLHDVSGYIHGYLEDAAFLILEADRTQVKGSMTQDGSGRTFKFAKPDGTFAIVLVKMDGTVHLLTYYTPE